jgi:flagellar hook-length control protein FliK
MIMNFDTAPAAPASTTTAAPAAAAPQPALLPGAPGHGPAALTAAVSSALSLFAQVLDGAAVGTQDAGAGAGAAAPAKEGDDDTRATDNQTDAGLSAMAAPVIGLPVNLLNLPPPADAAAPRRVLPPRRRCSRPRTKRKARRRPACPSQSGTQHQPASGRRHPERQATASGGPRHARAAGGRQSAAAAQEWRRYPARRLRGRAGPAASAAAPAARDAERATPVTPAAHNLA